MIWERGQGRAGRGHCARCFTPTICGNAGCPCHVPAGVTCRRPGCTAGLFVTIPRDTSAADSLARDLANYAAWKKAA